MSTIEQEIATWANSRPTWQQAVLRRLARDESFDQDAIDSLVAALVEGKSPPASPLKASDIPGAQSSGATVQLRSLRDLTNINALAGSQTLTFAPSGLTVVYGDNASGKSGYARVIKSVVRARHQEPVHLNVFTNAPADPQKAEVVFDSNGQEKKSSWPDAASSELRAVTYYDEACGDAYLGGESELTYRPAALTMIDGLIFVCHAVRAVLDEALSSNQAARGHLPSVGQGTDSSRFLLSLKGATSDAEVDAACAAPPDADEHSHG